MIVDEAISEAKASMEKGVESLKVHLAKIRTGRANVTMLDAVRVNYYGQPTPLNQVAALSCPDAKSFLIAPWEATVLKEIETGIIKSDIGMTPINDGKVIRLRLPDLTEERRKDIAKTVKKIVEDARIAVRHARRDANEMVKMALKEKEISEDDEKRAEAEIQKITDTFIKTVDAIGNEKEKEILTI